MSRFAIALCMFSCVAAPRIPDPGREFVDRGLAYLALALEAPNDLERRRLCDQSEQSCRLGLEYDDRFIHAHDCLGLIELSCHRSYERAADHFKRALSLDSDFAEAHNNLGVTFQRRDPPQYDVATEEFLAALEIDPRYADARANLAVVLMHLDRWEEARAHLMRLVEIAPTRIDARHLLGLANAKTGRAEEAELQLRSCLRLDPEHPECSYELGNLYLAAERYEDAILAYVTATRYASPVEIAARQNMRIAYQRSANRDGALRIMIARCAASGDAACHYDLGALFAERGLFDKAVEEWRATVLLAPSYCAAHHRLAMEANRILDSGEAERGCRATIECAKSAPDPRVQAMGAECSALISHLSAGL